MFWLNSFYWLFSYHMDQWFFVIINHVKSNGFISIVLISQPNPKENGFVLIVERIEFKTENILFAYCLYMCIFTIRKSYRNYFCLQMHGHCVSDNVCIWLMTIVFLSYFKTKNVIKVKDFDYNLFSRERHK